MEKYSVTSEMVTSFKALGRTEIEVSLSNGLRFYLTDLELCIDKTPSYKVENELYDDEGEATSVKICLYENFDNDLFDFLEYENHNCISDWEEMDKDNPNDEFTNEY